LEVRLIRLIDEADWSGIVLASVGVQGKTSGYEYDGYRYVTPGEVAVAKLLDATGVPFTPDVSVKVRHPDWNDILPMVYTPDFVFNGLAYVWMNEDGSREVVHGIEVKHRTKKGDFPTKGLRKIEILRKAKGINIKILDELSVRKLERLPLTPLKSE
jgi:hypothetical protein